MVMQARGFGVSVPDQLHSGFQPDVQKMTRTCLIAVVVIALAGCASSGTGLATLPDCSTDYSDTARALSLSELEAQGGVPPVLIGGLRGLQEKLTLEEAPRTGGRKLVAEAEFVVDTEGCARQIRIVKSEHDGIAAALVRALSESHFEPATLRGTPVEVIMMLPASVASSR